MTVPGEQPSVGTDREVTSWTVGPTGCNERDERHGTKHDCRGDDQSRPAKPRRSPASGHKRQWNRLLSVAAMANSYLGKTHISRLERLNGGRSGPGGASARRPHISRE